MKIMHCAQVWNIWKHGGSIQLKGWCHEIENGYNWYQKKDQKNLVLPEQMFNSSQRLFMI
jgi:hypothetical protein